MLDKDPNTTAESDPDCTEVLEENSKSILLGIISQLRKEMDLHRVTLPTFVLEPRSMLERITDFMSHPELLLDASVNPEPLDRFIGVVRYFLSGWHIKPKGVKKPYNPVLGEVFKCRWKYNNNTNGYYIAEQVSHHPPKSAYYFANPEAGIYIQGEIIPKAKFLGNSAATMMEGESHILFSYHHNERYDITMPNVYAKGILFGKMVLELGDKCKVRCKSSDLICELDFKTKGFFSGRYNSVVGKIKKESTNKVLYEIHGQWSSQIYIKSPSKNGDKSILFDATTASIFPKLVQAEADQDPLESRRLWSQVTAAIKRNDMDEATKQKSIIEDEQRKAAKERQDTNMKWTPRYFAKETKDDDQYGFKGHSKINSNDPTDAMAKLESSIFSNDVSSSKLLFLDKATTATTSTLPTSN
ncbi:uncharacterized protein BX664DRAFT_276571, partial [Halteromyces radiatus]|uniref:uncharacterized protein n=1 Tax=Halteromyces radiatus TaxID=101107 RepID=UPI0022201BDE